MKESKLTFEQLPQAVSLLLEQMERIEASLNAQSSKDEQTPNRDSEVFLTRKETADFFKISLYTVHEWKKKGIIKPYKAGNRTYFKQSELVEVLNNSNSQ